MQEFILDNYFFLPPHCRDLLQRLTNTPHLTLNINFGTMVLPFQSGNYLPTYVFERAWVGSFRLRGTTNTLFVNKIYVKHTIACISARKRYLIPDGGLSLRIVKTCGQRQELATHDRGVLIREGQAQQRLIASPTSFIFKSFST